MSNLTSVSAIPIYSHTSAATGPGASDFRPNRPNLKRGDLGQTKPELTPKPTPKPAHKPIQTYSFA